MRPSAPSSSTATFALGSPPEILQVWSCLLARCARERAHFARHVLPDSKSALENDFGNRDGKENAADDRVEAEESDVDPLETAPSGDPVFEHQATHNDEPADQVGDTESAEDAEKQQQTAHDQV